jgi:DNA (cytosine-5)-methyltransferase 1
MPTVCGQRGDWAKTTVLLGQQSEARARHADEPAPTIATSGAIGKIDYIVTMDHQGSNGSCVRGIGEPLSSATTKARHCLLSSFLVSYYGTNCSSSVADAVPTITCKDRFAVVRPSLEIVDAPNGTFRRVSYAAWKRLVLAQARQGKRMTRLFVECADGFVRMVEITHRMLQDYELALAQGFPASYRFKGNKTQKVKQIGNAVPPNGACAIVAACLTQNSNVSWLWQ